jgi:hypothetical protein
VNIIEVARKIPLIGKDIFILFWTPRQFAVQTLQDIDRHGSKKEVLGWSLAFSLLIFSVYPLLSGHTLTESLSNVMGLPTSTRSSDQSVPTPAFDKLGFVFGAGIGVDFPFAFNIPLDKPQPVIFRFGPGELLVDNVVPSGIGTKVANLLLLNISIYSTFVCLYPATRIWRSRLSWVTTLWFTNFVFSALWVFGTILILFEGVLLHDVFHVRMLNLPFVEVFGIILLFLLPAAIIMVRAVWSCFKSIFALTRAQFVLSLFIAWLLSFIIAPVALYAAFIVVKFQPWFEALL